MTTLHRYTTDLDYLEDELAWIEARCRRLIVERRLAELPEPDQPRVLDLPGRRGRHLRPIDDDEVIKVTRRLQRLARTRAAQEGALRQSTDRRLQITREAGCELALDRLARCLGLDDFERTVVLLAVAMAFDKRFAELLGELTEDAYGLSTDTAMAFAGLSMAERIGRRRAFALDAPLRANDLVVLTGCHSRHISPADFLDVGLQVTSRTFQLLIGQPDADDELMEFSSLERPRATLERVVLADAVRRRLLAVVDHHDRVLHWRAQWGLDEVIEYGRGALVLLHGPPGTGKTMTAHALAHHTGRRVLTVDLPTFVEHDDAGRFLPGLFREARLHEAVLFFDECEVLMGSRREGNLLMTLLLTELERFEGVAILATNLPELLDEALERRILVRARFEAPDAGARLAIWRNHLPDTLPLADDVDLEQLAERFALTGGLIKNAVLMAAASAVHRDPESPHIDHALLEQAARDQTERVLDTRPAGFGAPG